MEFPIMLFWRGWEYETPNGLHMYMSKRHIIVDGQTACGKRPPRGIQPHSGHGDGMCERCWAAIPRLEKRGYQIQMS